MVQIEEFSTKSGRVFICKPDNSEEPAVMALTSVNVPPLLNREDYISFPEEQIVRSVINELEDGSTDTKYYLVRFLSHHTDIVSHNTLLELENGPSALSDFENGIEQDFEDLPAADTSEIALGVDSSRESSPASNGHDVRSSRTRLRSLKTSKSYITADDENSADEIALAPARIPGATRSSRRLRLGALRDGGDAGESLSESDQSTPPSGGNKRRRRNPPRGTNNHQSREASYIELVGEDDDTSSSDNLNLLQSDVLPARRKRKSTRKNRAAFDKEIDGVKFSKPRRDPTRSSTRTTKHISSMKEKELDDVQFADSDSARAVPKAIGLREVFPTLPMADPFLLRHCQQCQNCGKWGGGPHGQLVNCQGCCVAYHKHCLGTRSSRDHLVTKVGNGECVLQCRRCINVARKKERTAPDLSACQICRHSGAACAPFRERKSAQQEEREREDNNGEDPVVEVPRPLINKPENVLFRCLYCYRAFHFHHLRPRSDTILVNEDEHEIANQRFKEYARDWKCIECVEQSDKKIDELVAWRFVDLDAYIAGAKVQDMNEDEKEYLIKWKNKSYFQCLWMPGPWVWAVTVLGTRRAFAKKNDNNNLPIMNAEDAIPEDYLRIDVVLDVKYTSIVETRVEDVDKARIREVAQAFVKFKGLGYEDTVWETPPDPSDSERWSDFVTAYDNWVMGRYVHVPKQVALKTRLEKVRATDFKTLEKKKQPDKLNGGELMQYQLDGLNWLYYRWYQMSNAILADEMGLGKTIQILGFLATLIQDHHCYPFLLVVPNSTCPNWRREIKKWAPSLRVVTYYGSAMARSLALQYELYPETSKDLRCHIVVTSYEAAADTSCQKFFRSVPWQGLVVDEGQRLKNDASILYSALSELKIAFKILLTGTPLQNNVRELFNLLQFLDSSFHAKTLEGEYSELNKETVADLHNRIRPFFLRRTKAQVLNFLPPLAQIILPVSMSTVQTKLYQSILSRNPELIRSIFDTSKTIAKTDRANLNNVLVQLRKTLCHPFVYSRDIEDRSVSAAVSHRNLVDASAKLQLLEILLPKLQKRGHRALIFSQFLEMLDIVEDFLAGLSLAYQRLDGTISSLEKQKRIDEFNNPGSSLFAFLLSTRAGGVGINLASADTVIILDPDFNPHRDIQALSRAHRIGQKNKVLVFQLMTRASAEERIIQVGRKKMALDHVLIEQMDKDDENSVDVESILRYGAADILEGRTQDIRYDDASVETLLDRSQIEDTKVGEDNTAESQFSFARVWANDAASMADSLPSDEEVDKAPDPSVWDKILSERARIAAEEALTRHEVLGRGKRNRQTVNYNLKKRLEDDPDQVGNEDSDSDTDFQGDKSDGDEDDENENDPAARDISDSEVKEVQNSTEPPGSQLVGNGTSQSQPRTAAKQKRPGDARNSATASAVQAPIGHPRPSGEQPAPIPFKRAAIVWPTNASQSLTAHSSGTIEGTESQSQPCYSCKTYHQIGHCPLKIAGPEYCNLCGLAHFGVARSCPHIKSETQVGEMLEALKNSPESRDLTELAKKYLRGVKGTLVQEKKRKAELAAQRSASQGGNFSTVQGQGWHAQGGNVQGGYVHGGTIQWASAQPASQRGNYAAHSINGISPQNTNIAATYMAQGMVGRPNYTFEQQHSHGKSQPGYEAKQAPQPGKTDIAGQQ